MNGRRSVRKKHNVSLTDEATLFPAIDGENEPEAATGSESRKRIAGGVTTSDVIVSAYVAGNEEVFPHVLDLHVPCGSIVADVTYGKGIFWKSVDLTKYK